MVHDVPPLLKTKKILNKAEWFENRGQFCCTSLDLLISYIKSLPLSRDGFDQVLKVKPDQCREAGAEVKVFQSFVEGRPCIPAQIMQ